MTIYNKKWRKRNPDKVKAHWTVSNAIRYGKLKRSNCERCGNSKSHAHHSDYSKPLEIKWLCHKCHWIAHGWEKKQNPPKEPGLKIKNVRGRAYNAKWHITKEKALEYRSQGYSYKQIGNKLNISKGTIFKWINNTTYQ